MSVDKEKIAIERLHTAGELSEQYYGKPLLIAYSGGKDSDVVIRLAKKSGIAFEVVHSHTTVDMPETVYHVRRTLYDLESVGIACKIHYPMYKGAPTSMWKLIVAKRRPPLRNARYCCDILKEGTGSGRFAATGVRWAESTRRKIQSGIYQSAYDANSKIKDRVKLSNDNDDKRLLFERCEIKASNMVNPIIDWTDSDVWDYVRDQHIQVCELYSKGRHRIGCIGCPMASLSQKTRDFREYPKHKRAYVRAFRRMLEARRAIGLQEYWRDEMDVFHWWLEDGVEPGQIGFFEEEAE